MVQSDKQAQFGESRTLWLGHFVWISCGENLRRRIEADLLSSAFTNDRPALVAGFCEVARQPVGDPTGAFRRATLRGPFVNDKLGRPTRNIGSPEIEEPCSINWLQEAFLVDVRRFPRPSD